MEIGYDLAQNYFNWQDANLSVLSVLIFLVRSTSHSWFN